MPTYLKLLISFILTFGFILLWLNSAMKGSKLDNLEGWKEEINEENKAA